MVKRRLQWGKRMNQGQQSAPVPLIPAFEITKNDPGLKSRPRDQTPASNRRHNYKATYSHVSAMTN